MSEGATGGLGRIGCTEKEPFEIHLLLVNWTCEFPQDKSKCLRFENYSPHFTEMNINKTAAYMNTLPVVYNWSKMQNCSHCFVHLEMQQCFIISKEEKS